MLQTRWSCLLLAVVLSACGPAGKITGRVTVEGASAAGIAVFVYGPSSGATVTDAEGAFTVSGVPDGEYVVRATVRDADVEEVSVTTTVAQGGTAAPEPVLNFKASSATVTGRVVFADGTEASNLTVIATGPETVGTRTAVDGTFSFSKIKNGAYVVSVEVRDTREGRVGIGVDASGTKDVGELRLTPVGQLKGTVQYNSMPAAGITVTVPGTSVSSVTDDMGVFALANVPTGTFSVLARTGSEPFYRSASSVVMVTRGVNADVALTLTDDAPKTGTIQGVVTFRGQRTPRDIQLTVPGTSVTGSPSANGAFALVVPVGVWEVVATAPSHPQLNLGRAEVREGAVAVLPTQTLSWFRSVWRTGAPINSASPYTSFGFETHNWALVGVDDGSDRLVLMNVLSGEVRVLAVGSFSGGSISKNARYVGWYVQTTAYVYEISSGTLTAFPGEDAVNLVAFSSDESVVFVRRDGASLTRIPLANPMTERRFPAMGVSASIVSHSADRWFVRSPGTLAGTYDFHLVTPTADVPQAFANARPTSLQSTPVAWAQTDCAATCTLKVLAPTAATAAVTVNGATLAPGVVDGWPRSSAAMPCFRVTTTGASFCADSTAGTRYPLPNGVTDVIYNTTGTRMLYQYNAGGLQTFLREEAVPPTMGTADRDASSATWNMNWISPTRAVAWETGELAGRKLHIISNGTAATVDTDVSTETIGAVGPLLFHPQLSTLKWRVMLGDGMWRTLEVPTTEVRQAAAARPFEGDTLTRYASISFDTLSSYLIDESAGVVRLRHEGRCFQGFRSGSVEFCFGGRSGGNFLMQFQSGAVIEFEDTSLIPVTFIGSQASTMGYIGYSLDRTQLMLGSITP